MANLALLGGTFDPPHNGHIQLAKAAADALQLDRIFFMPTGNPNFKRDCHVTDASVRLEMVRRACLSDERFEASAREVEREGITYTADTLRQLAQDYPHDKLIFIVGGDSAEHIMTWRDAQTIAELCRVVAVARRGYDFERARQAHEASDIVFDITFLEADVADISSTQVRDYVRQGKPIDALVPKAVEEYILSMGLYKDEE